MVGEPVGAVPVGKSHILEAVGLKGGAQRKTVKVFKMNKQTISPPDFTNYNPELYDYSKM